MTLLLPIALGALGVVMIAAGARALRPEPPNPARAHAQSVMRSVWAHGEWADGDSVVWRDGAGWWHIEEEVGVTITSSGDIEAELEDHHWRSVARSKRRECGGCGMPMPLGAPCCNRCGSYQAAL